MFNEICICKNRLNFWAFLLITTLYLYTCSSVIFLIAISHRTIKRWMLGLKVTMLHLFQMPIMIISASNFFFLFGEAVKVGVKVAEDTCSFQVFLFFKSQLLLKIKIVLLLDLVGEAATACCYVGAAALPNIWLTALSGKPLWNAAITTNASNASFML